VKREFQHLMVRVVPGAASSGIVGWEPAGPAAPPGIARVLRVRLAAPPTEGKANTELVRLLAASLGLPKASVRLVRGTTSRFKTIELPAGLRLPDW
jgi:uncharacterized protein